MNHSRLWFQQSCVEHEEDKQTRTLNRMGRRDDRDTVSLQLKCTEHSKNECFSSPWHPVSQQLKYMDCIWNVMAHAQKPDFVFRQTRRVHLNRRGHQFSLLLAAEVHTSVIVMLDTTCSKEVRRVPATHSICQFLHFPSRASPCAITFQMDST